MGLTIHYSLRSEARTPNEARRLVERLHQAARDLPFNEVGEVVELAGGETRFEDATGDEGQQWLLVQAVHWLQHEAGVSRLRPEHVIAFSTWPGPGCEAANFGLCRYPATINVAGRPIPTRLPAWHWNSFCKTQYTSNPDAGGVANFVRCHLVVIKLLDRARQLGLLAEVKDEGGFWETRNVASLVKTIGQWNRHMAGLVGRINDWFGGEFVAPITDYPDFEHLEAEGLREGTDDASESSTEGSR